jgi:hypothetical protein
MTILIDKTTLEQIFGDEATLQQGIADYVKALQKHSKTKNKPAPTSHPFIEEVVRKHEGAYVVVVNEQDLPPDVADGFQPIQPVPLPPPTLEQMKDEVRWRLSDRREQRVVEGVMVSGHRFSGHTHQLALIAATLALPGTILVQWMDADWLYVDVDRPALTAILQKVVAMIHECYRNEKRIATLIAQAPTEQKLKLITLEDGWPAL